MSKDAVFTMKLESELRDQFLAAADAVHRPASQIVRELMREFVQRQQDQKDYDDFLLAKVEKARASAAAGRVHDNEEVSAFFAARRARVNDTL